MATVYLAEDLKHHRRVAIKVLRPELAASLGPDRFSREIEVAARLQHPHILGVLDSGDADGFFYYVMPFVEGETLRDRLARAGELPIPEAVRLLSEIAEALAVAHGAGVVHRDIKPENVLLSGRHAMVMDFGVAKAVSEASGRQQLTTAGVALGTPAYMAPEQASADPQMDGRADIYALGVLGYEMLAGHTPFPGLNPQQTLAATVTQTPPPLGQQRAGLSPALEAVIMRCLAKRPADRFQTADDLVMALEPLATPSGGMTPTQTRPVPAWQATTSGPRRWIPVAAGTGLLVAALWGWRHFGGGAAPRIQPDRVQFTFTGNATSPGISQDGHRIAYATRQCDDEGRCTQDVVVQDVAGAGKATVVKGALGVQLISWSTDERYLLLNGAAFGSRVGVFSVPVLGGEPRYLGCCAGTIANGDTVLITTPAAPGDSLAWVRWVTLADGMAHDSLAVKAGIASGIEATAFPDGRLLDLVRVQPDRTVSVIMTRQGIPIDSLVYPPQQPVLFATTTADARSLLVGVTRGGTQEADVLRYHLDTRGHIDAAPDTLIRQLSASGGGDLSRSGLIAYANGPAVHSVWAMRRDSPASMQFVQRRLSVSTDFIGAGLSPSGDWVLLRRPTHTSDGRLQLSIMPFDSGAETLLGPPLSMTSLDWGRDGRSIIVASRRGADSVTLDQIDVPSGQSHHIETVAAPDFVDVEAVPGGGVLVLLTGKRFRRVHVPGVSDSTLRLPAALGDLGQSAFDPSPDGRAMVTVSWNDLYDSILVHRISVIDGGMTRLAGFAAVDVDQPRWLQDGTIIVPIAETLYSTVWYRLPAGGGPPERLGSPPRFPAKYWLSADGRRMLATAAETRPDIFLIPNFGEMLKQR